MKRIMLALALLSGGAHALTVSGDVSGTLPRNAHLSAWWISATGEPLGSVADTPLGQNTFTLNIPDVSPASRALHALRADNLVWPGLSDPVRASATPNIAELKLFWYTDGNNNGRRDTGEGLTDVAPFSERGLVSVVWSEGAAQVTGGRGYALALVPGWNVFAAEPRNGAQSVTSLGNTVRLRLNLGR